jgi:uncharacterized iron-regulated protein
VTGCAARGDRGPAAAPPARARLVIPADADLGAAAAQVAARAGRAAIVYLGELHDNPQHHAIQARVLAALLAAGVRPAVAFEMLPETAQGRVETLVRGELPGPEVGRRLAWRARGWPDFAMYWPLFELARTHALPVIATDLDPGITRRITRDGLAAAGDGAARLRSALPDDPARDGALARRFRAAHCNAISEDAALRMVVSWYARNVVIARRILDARAQASRVVVIIGRGHQAAGGVPDQVTALRPGTPQLIVALAEEREDGGLEGPDLARADVVWLTPARRRPDPCQDVRDRIGRARPGAPGFAV